MITLRFLMSGDPRGKGRPRATVRGGFASVFTDPKTRAYEARVAEVARAVMAGREPLRGALTVALRFRIPIPVSMSKRLRAAVLAGEADHFGRVDFDNAAKAVCDGFNGIVWHDDVQITRSVIFKQPSLTPGVDVIVTALRQQEHPSWN